MEIQGWIIHCSLIIFLTYFWYKVNKSLFNDIASPFSLILYTWVLPLLLTGFNLSNLETSWSFTVYFAICLVTSILIISTILPIFMGYHFPKLIYDESNSIKIYNIINSKKGSKILAFLYTILISIYIYFDFIINPGGFLLINYFMGGLSIDDAQNYNWMRGESRSALTSVVLILNSFLNIICGIYFIRYMQLRDFRRYLYFIISISMIVFGLIKLSKTDAMNAFTTIFFLYIYRDIYELYNKKISWKNKFKIFLLLLSMIFFMFYSTSVIRVNELSSDNSLISQLEYKIEEPNIFIIIAEYIYTYTAINFENVARLIDSYHQGLNLGISGFRPILSIFMQGHIAAKQLASIEWNTINDWAIAGTFISPIFAESQWIGIILFPVIYGFIINFLYTKFRKSKSLIYLFLYINFGFCWIFLFFSNAFATLNYYLNIVFIIIIFKILDFLKNK